MKEISLVEVRAELCKRLFYKFFTEFWETIESVELITNWHIKYICDYLQGVYEQWEQKTNQKDIYINVPPGMSKSTICTQLFPVWLWVKNPAIRIISSSYSEALSTAHAIKSKDVINSDKFKLYFSDLIKIKAGQDGKTWYKNESFGERFATSTGGTVTGVHADFIIIDDPINVKKSESKVERETANKHVYETLSTRKTDKKRSVTIVVMQRLHEQDVTGEAFKRGKEINHVCLPAELSDNINPSELAVNYSDGLLDVNRLDRETLQSVKASLGSYGYAGQMMQTPAPEGGGQIKKAWFGIIPIQDFMQIKKGSPIFFADTAYTSDKANDPTALMTCYYIDNRLYIWNSESVYKEFPELIKYLDGYMAVNGYSNQSIMYVEPKASGKSIVQTLKATKYNVMEGEVPKDDKVTRVSAVSPSIEAGKVILVEGNWNESFLNQCASFPNGQHDDEVDNLVNAVNRLNKPQNTTKLSFSRYS